MRKVAHTPTLTEAAVQRALDQLKGIVRSRGLKSSAVREVVARAALEREGHFTVEELVKTLRDGGVTDAHPSTVYRILPLLVDAGLIQVTLISTGDELHYERAFEREHHDHLICTRCGKVVEFHFEAVELLQQDVARKFGFELTGHVHELLGVCKGCRLGTAAH